MTPAEIFALTTGAATTISTDTCRKIKHVYSWILSRTAGGMLRECGPTPLARKHGWAPPAAWDDIDDPEEEQQPRVLFDGKRHQEFRIVVAHAGSDNKAALLLGISSTMVADLKKRRNKTLSSLLAFRVRETYQSLSQARVDMLTAQLNVSDHQRRFLAA